jgi:TolB protein
MHERVIVILVFVLSCNAARAQNRVQITHHPAEDRAPAWSPNGTRLLFDSDRDGNRSIYVVDVSGSNLERVTSLEHVDQYSAWSPDGERIVFQSERNEHNGHGGLWVMELDSGEETPLLGDSSPELTPDWSPDGRFVAFTSERSGNIDLWAMPVFGSALIRLTTSSFRDVWPRWSPDGRSILFFSRRDTNGERDELYVMDWDSREVERVTHNPTHHDFAPDWAPDGKRIVTGVSDSDSDRALVVYDRSGRLEHRFADGFHRVFQPTWSPDGRWIAFAARVEEGARADIYLEPAPPQR